MVIVSIQWMLRECSTGTGFLKNKLELDQLRGVADINLNKGYQDAFRYK